MECLVDWNLKRLEIVSQEATGPASGGFGKNDGFEGFLKAYCRELVHLCFSFFLWPQNSADMVWCGDFEIRFTPSRAPSVETIARSVSLTR